MGIREIDKRLAELNSSDRLSLLNETLEHFQKSGNNEAVCDVLFLLGSEYTSTGELSKGGETYQRAAELFQSTGNLNGEAISYNNLGFIHKVLGDTETALNFYNKALDIYRKAGSKQRESKVLSNTGKLYFDSGEYLEAIECFEDALELPGDSGDDQNSANILVALGSSYLKANDLPRALEAFNKSLELRKNLGDKKGVSVSLKLAAGVYLLMGEEDKAEKLIMNNAEIAWKPLDSTDSAADTYEGSESAQNSAHNLAEISRNVVEMVKQSSEAKNLSLIFRQETGNIPVMTNREEASELIRSLVLRAIDWTEAGKSVYVYAGFHGGKARCEVIDEGADMTADEASEDPVISGIRDAAEGSSIVLSHEKMIGAGNTFILEFYGN